MPKATITYDLDDIKRLITRDLRETHHMRPREEQYNPVDPISVQGVLGDELDQSWSAPNHKIAALTVYVDAEHL